MILLTDEEIENTRLEAIIDEPCSTPPEVLKDIQLKAIAKAQLKKVHRYGDEHCHHQPGLRRQCPMCWQSLLDEVKGA